MTDAMTMLQEGGDAYYTDHLRYKIIERDMPKDGLLMWLSAKHGVDNQVETEDVFRWTNQKFDSPYEFLS